jgi:hypothetical protein
MHSSKGIDGRKAGDTPIVKKRDSSLLNRKWHMMILWGKWGPYLSERKWGVAGEDYSESGDAWN